LFLHPARRGAQLKMAAGRARAQPGLPRFCKLDDLEPVEPDQVLQGFALGEAIGPGFISSKGLYDQQPARSLKSRLGIRHPARSPGPGSVDWWGPCGPRRALQDGRRRGSRPMKLADLVHAVQ